MNDAGNVAPMALRRRVRGRIAAIAAMAVAAGLATCGTAAAAPGPLAFSLMENQISSVVEQQSPTYFYAPCSNGAGGPENCDPSTWVTNPFSDEPCVWDVDDHFLMSGAGNVNAGATATGRICMIADGDTVIGDPSQDHMLRATVWAPSSTLTVTLRNDHGAAITMAPQADGKNGWRYYACVVDHTPGPYPAIAGSNGGVGVKVHWQLAVTAGARTVKGVYAMLEHPLIGTQTWFDAGKAGCT
jgi:hypothetical protein